MLAKCKDMSWWGSIIPRVDNKEKRVLNGEVVSGK